MRGPPRNSGRTLAIVAVCLALQLGVSAAALFGPRPARFAWQMYARLPELPAVWAESGGQEPTRVEIGDLFAVMRAEIDYTAALQAGACDLLDADAVLIQQSGQTSVERTRCS